MTSGSGQLMKCFCCRKPLVIRFTEEMELWSLLIVEYQNLKCDYRHRLVLFYHHVVQ